jgi:lipoprotein-releasing system permease protein
MDWRFFIAKRYFKIRRKEKFISIISLISILGVVVGVAALIIVLGVMSGFNRELKARIVGTTPHIIIERDGGIANPDIFIEEVLAENENVISSSPFIQGEAILRQGEKFTGVIVTGIDEATEKDVTNIKQYVIKGQPATLGKRGIFVGSELADELNLKVGDSVSIISAALGAEHNFEIAGIFRTGLYTVDINNIFISLKPAQEVFNVGNFVTRIAVRTVDELKANKIKREIAVKLGFPYFVRSWIDLNQNLFSALKLEKIVQFVIVALVVMVACFNIASTLIVRVVEKTKDIGILKAIGATNSDIRSIFRFEGLFIGIIGTVLGLGVGLTVNWIQDTYKIVKLPPDVYYIEALPVYISWHEPLIIAISAVFLSLIATVYPSSKAARLNVVDALRYE